MQNLGRYILNFFAQLSPGSVKLLNSLLAFGLVTFFCLALSLLPKLQSEYDVKQFFPKKHTLLESESRVIGHFKLNGKSSVIVMIENRNNDSWISKKSIHRLRAFDAAVESIPQVTKAYSLSHLQGTFEANGNLYVGDLFSQVPAQHWTTMLKNHPFVRPNLLSTDNKTTLVALQLNNNSPQTIDIVKTEIEKIRTKHFSDFKISFGGVPVLQSDVTQILRSELVRSTIIGFIVFVGILSLVFSHFSGIIMSLLTLLFVNIFCLGILAVLNIKFDVLLSTLPVLVSLSVISLTVHILSRLSKSNDYKNATHSHEKFLSLLKILTELFGENLLASLTTSIGFLMLMFSDVGIINKYGKFVALVIILACLATQIVLIPLVSFLPKVTFKKWSSQSALWSLRLLKRRRLFIFSTLAIALSGAFSFSFLNWNTRLFDDLPQKNVSRINTEKIDKSFGGTLPVSIVIFGSENTWKDPLVINKINLLANEIKSLHSVGAVMTIADFLKKSTSRGVRMPASESESAESYFMYSMAPEDPLISYINPQFNLARIDVRLKDLPAYDIQKDHDQMKNLVQKYFPNYPFNMSGMGFTVHAINQEMSKELIFGFWQSLALIGFILIFVFKSIRWAIVACLPNLVPPLALLFVLASTQTPIKPGIAIIFSIAIGLAFSNTVYLLGRLKRISKEKKLKHYLPIKAMMNTEFVPCLLATLLVVSGFSVFTFSYFEMNKLFGVYMLISILAGAFGDLVFLPSFLYHFPKTLLPKQPKNLTVPAKSFVAFLLFIFAFSTHTKSQATTNQLPDSADIILKKSLEMLKSKDDVSDVTMKIIEKDGSIKERKLFIKRKFSNKHFTLVRLKTPIDLKGTAVLNIVDKNTQEQYLYLPSTKQVRRIVGQNSKSGVLGSELVAEDLDFSTLKGSETKFVKQLKVGSEDFALIEIKSKTNKTSYSKALLLISLRSYLPARLEYYDAKQRAVKRIEFEKYISVSGAHRAQSIKIKNLVNGRGTDLNFSNMKSNSGLSDDEFSQRALSRE